MNIFVLDKDPVKAAKYIDDQRISKMIIETGQMMRAALGRHDFNEDMCIEWGILTSKGTPWKVTHKNHPCTLWAGDDYDNFMWLGDYGLALCNEFFDRYGKAHACHFAVMRMRDANIIERVIPKTGGMTPFAQAMPDEYKDDDAVFAYRRYYKSKDNIRYRKTDVPTWWEVTA